MTAVVLVLSVIALVNMVGIIFAESHLARIADCLERKEKREAKK